MRRLGSKSRLPGFGIFMNAPGFIGQDVAVLYVVRCHAKSRDGKTLGVSGRSFWDESWEGSPNPLENESFPEVSFYRWLQARPTRVGRHTGRLLPLSEDHTHMFLFGNTQRTHGFQFPTLSQGISRALDEGWGVQGQCHSLISCLASGRGVGGIRCRDQQI